LTTPGKKLGPFGTAAAPKSPEIPAFAASRSDKTNLGNDILDKPKGGGGKMGQQSLAPIVPIAMNVYVNDRQSPLKYLATVIR
jgi:hypothetical protein